jgi:hypothetical protein
MSVAHALPAAVVSDFTERLSRELWGGGRIDVAALAAGGELEAFARDVDGLGRLERGDLAIALHPVQVRSKLWLLDELKRHCDLGRSTLVVLGAWYGILPLLAEWTLASPPRRSVCVDIDPAVCAIGERLVGARHPAVEYRSADLRTFRADDLEAPVIVNTSCEHVADLEEWWARVPRGQLVVLQSNDFTACPEHVNCVADVEELARQAPMAERRFAGTLPLGDLRRFMLIGVR